MPCSANADPTLRSASLTSIDDIERILRRHYDLGYVELRDRSRKDLLSSVTLKEALEIARTVIRLRPRTTLETGVALGMSTLAICLAQEMNGQGCHFGVDPCQSSEHKMAAIQLLEAAGIEHRFQLLEGPAHLELPKLIEKGQFVDFAFIDGMHTFDYKLFDFFLADKLLTVGGILGFHDCLWDSTKKVLRFALSHRKYRLVGSDASLFDPHTYRKSRRPARIVRHLRSIELPLRRTGGKNLLMLEKIESWEPPFEYFAAF
jgi:predicted O-methyltransferase YrrM